MKKIISLLLALLLCLSLLPAALASGEPDGEAAIETPAADDAGPEASEEPVGDDAPDEPPPAEDGEAAYDDEAPARDETPALDGASVGLNVAYRSQADITAFAKANPIYPGTVSYAAAPSLSTPYRAGSLSADTVGYALNAVNLARYIAGLSADITENSSYSAAAQAAALVNAVNGSMSHYPAQPSGMDGELYKLGAAGAQSSNLGWGYANFTAAVFQGWMRDEDSGNIAQLGHRRWVLNPVMRQAGFGMAGTQCAMFVFDNWGETPSESLVAWPAMNMPHTLFQADDPWSVSVGSSVNMSRVSVTLTRRSDGKIWRFSQSSADGYFNVSNDNYGQPGCIIFRPDGVGAYSAGDHFDVTVTGALGSAVAYSVDFFDLCAGGHSYATVKREDVPLPDYAELQCVLCGEATGNAYSVSGPGDDASGTPVTLVYMDPWGTGSVYFRPAGGGYYTPLSGWWLIGGAYYHFTDGLPDTGTVTIGFDGYTFDAQGRLLSGGGYTQQNGWQRSGTSWYYYKNNVRQTGWLRDGGKWYYLEADGVMATGWVQVSGVWYYLRGDGAMVTGWKQLGRTWYYFRGDGAMVTGWKQLGGKWYFFKGSGAMATGWQLIGGKWYFMNASGAMRTGWVQGLGAWYYMGKSGAMLTDSWVKSGGKWYYMDSDGVMVTDTTLILKGVGYSFGADGAWIE